MFDSVTTSALLASVLWGGIGGGFVIYGWRQKVVLPFVVGAALTAISFFMLNSALYMSLASIATLAAFFWLKRQGY